MWLNCLLILKFVFLIISNFATKTEQKAHVLKWLIWLNGGISLLQKIRRLRWRGVSEVSVYPSQ